jgi:hypothetical protein
MFTYDCQTNCALTHHKKNINEWICSFQDDEVTFVAKDHQIRKKQVKMITKQEKYIKRKNQKDDTKNKK